MNNCADKSDYVDTSNCAGMSDCSTDTSNSDINTGLLTISLEMLTLKTVGIVVENAILTWICSESSE